MKWNKDNCYWRYVLKAWVILFTFFSLLNISLVFICFADGEFNLGFYFSGLFCLVSIFGLSFYGSHGNIKMRWEVMLDWSKKDITLKECQEKFEPIWRELSQ